jgi:RNA polymerase sigma-70 factor (ECF subfamily)
VSGLAADLGGPRGVDPESRAWLERLRADGPEQVEALAELHALLLRAAVFALSQRRRLYFQVGRAGVDEIAFEATAEAMLAVLARLGEFRGESRFTTWAAKFSIVQVAVATRRRRWLGRELPDDQAGLRVLAFGLGPERSFEHAEFVALLKRGLAEALTSRQREVFVALALNEVPIDVLAERLGTTRGALYKTLHDARERLRSHLAAEGVLPDGWRGGRPAAAPVPDCG